MSQSDPAAGGGRPLRAILKVVVLIALVVAANHLFAMVRAALDINLSGEGSNGMWWVIAVIALAYTISLAIPFVPGVEIGVGLMIAFGMEVVPLVYGCTVGGMMLAYLVGRVIRLDALIRFAEDLRLRRVVALLQRFAEVPDEKKSTFILLATPNPFLRGVLRHRYIALAVLVNLPGNFVIGGGGGIALLSGASRMFRTPLFILTIMLAVAPVPLAILVFGPEMIAG